MNDVEQIEQLKRLERLCLWVALGGCAGLVLVALWAFG